MEDITIILPIHKYRKEDLDMLTKALQSVASNRKTYTAGKLSLICVCPENVKKQITPILKKEIATDFNILVNKENTDFCSQINLAAKSVTDDYFSILEFDDVYKENWFQMAEKYYYTNETVTLFLPINLFVLTHMGKHIQYGNEIAWAGSFSNDLGYIDFDALKDFTSFNLTGGIFNTKDFNTLGGFNTEIKIAFNYDYLLKATSKKLKVFVVPKEGYVHYIGRKDSLTDIYNKEFNTDEIAKIFDSTLASYEDKSEEINK